MGRRIGAREHLFYEFRLDEVAPDDHLVRKVDAVLDLSGVNRLTGGPLFPNWPPFDQPGAG